MSEKLKRNSDAVVGTIMLLAVALLTINVMEIKTVQSRIMPFFAIGCIALGSLYLIFRTLVLHKSPCVNLIHKKRELIVWLMFTGLFLLIQTFGFYSASFIFVFFCYLYLAGFTKEKLVKSLIFSVAFIAVMYLCFTVLIKVSMPVGLLF